ncbi:MAG TPA: succinate dehydrogenase cytochrome b subunit [Candidatus Acidoferrum sp.]|nr:succinate dehydrogenase cytochrome b subunit [Candidatus Acidoferrum sp.]
MLNAPLLIQGFPGKPSEALRCSASGRQLYPRVNRRERLLIPPRRGAVLRTRSVLTPAALDAPSGVHNLKGRAARLMLRQSVVNIFASFYRSSVGKKMIVAVTGVILILFVIGHLLGNLQIFLGPDWINGYSQHLRDLGPLLWAIRLFLLTAVVVHIYVTIQLAIENRRARPEAYVDREYVKATFASRHMLMSGLIVLAFIVYHIAHFTVRVTDPRFGLLKADPLGHYDVYSMMVYGFQNYYVSAFYVLGLFLLALHLSHGSSSFFQSLGFNDKKLTPRLALGGRIFAWLLFVSYTSIPIAILLGMVKPAQQL